MQALDADVVKAKIFDVIVKPTFEQSMLDLGKCFGVQVGDMLAEVKMYLNCKLQQLKDGLDRDTTRIRKISISKPISVNRPMRGRQRGQRIKPGRSEEVAAKQNLAAASDPSSVEASSYASPTN